MYFKVQQYFSLIYFMPLTSFTNPLKTSKNLFFIAVRVCWKRPVAWNELISWWNEALIIIDSRMSKGRLNSFLKQIQIRCFLLSLFSLNRADNEKMQYSKTSAPGHLFNSTISQKITKKKKIWIKKPSVRNYFK